MFANGITLFNCANIKKLPFKGWGTYFMVVIITGASKGIGRAVAEKFAASGNTLVLCARNFVLLQAVADELAEKYTNSTIGVKAVDISIKEDVIAFGNWAQQTAGIADVVINNAAYFTGSSIHGEEDGLLDEMLATNLGGAYHLTRTLLPAMMERKSGHIFNICSVASLKGSANGGSYSISKFALHGFTKNLLEEMKPYGIKVTGVYPGAVYTESWHGSGVQPETMIQPNDIAELIYTAAQLSPQACVEEIIIKPL